VGWPVLRVIPQEEARAKGILARYTDKDWSLCDAMSFAFTEGTIVIARERSGEVRTREQGEIRCTV
jgi:hypothetical protein